MLFVYIKENDSENQHHAEIKKLNFQQKYKNKNLLIDFDLIYKIFKY